MKSASPLAPISVAIALTTDAPLIPLWFEPDNEFLTFHVSAASVVHISPYSRFSI